MVIKAVLRAFVVEIELIGRAAVIGRRVRDKALRVVDVTETGQVYAGGVDGGGKDYNVLAGQEGAAVISFGTADRIVGDQNRRYRPVELRRQPQHYVVYECGRVSVLGFLINAGAEGAKPALIKAGDAHDLDRASGGLQRQHLRCRDDMEVSGVLRKLRQKLKGAGVIVIFCSKQQHYRAVRLAKRPDEMRHGVVHVLKGRISPYARAVKKVAGDDCEVGLLCLGGGYDSLHTPQGIKPAEVLAVFRRPCQVAEVCIGGM